MTSPRDSKPDRTDVEPPLVLVVEDDETVRNIVTRTLTEAGYRVIPAANPAEATAKFRLARHRIDLLVADIVLPHHYGTVLYKQLRRLQPSLEVLFISGFPDIGRGAGRTRLPGTPFLYKPFTSFELRRAVARIIAGEEPSPGDEDADGERADGERANRERADDERADEPGLQAGLQPGVDRLDDDRSQQVTTDDRPVADRRLAAGLLGV